MHTRRQGLARTKGLARGAGLQRKAGLKPRSKRMARTYVDRRALVAALLSAHPWCQIRWDRDCQGRAVDVHEPLTRARLGSVTDRANCVTTCRHCHDQVHNHPAAARERGWLIPSGGVCA